MRYSKKDISIEEGLVKEWIITNGIGGYASSSIIGCNTRKYHGLLVAPLTPPARRFLILSKIDESIEIKDKKYNLYTNMGRNYISEGYKYQENFEKDYIPIFTYKIEDIQIRKLICMKYMENTVCILYKIKNGNQPIKLTLAPILNFRDFHQINQEHDYNLKQNIKGRKVKVVVDNNSQTPIYIYSNTGNYIEHKNDNFKNMFYIEEEKRGFFPEEDHAVCGRYEIEIAPNEEKEVQVICSLEENIEEINVNNVIDAEVKRINEIIQNSGLVNLREKNQDMKYNEQSRDITCDDIHIDIENNQQNKKYFGQENDRKYELIKDYIIATDNFVVYRPVFRLHTLIAGYHWFLDWGRDALISFEGLLLIPKRYDIAKEVLLTFIKNIKFGLVPNGYSGFDNRPLYNSVDASLLLFEQVRKYLNYTKDYKFVKEKIYNVLKGIIDAYINGIDLDNNNIYLDEDYLLVSRNTRDSKHLDGCKVCRGCRYTKKWKSC